MERVVSLYNCTHGNIVFFSIYSYFLEKKPYAPFSPIYVFEYGTKNNIAI